MSSKQNPQSIDGFSLRRRSSVDAPLGVGKSGVVRPAVPHQFLRPSANRASAVSSAAPEILPQPAAVRDTGLHRAEIDASLQAVDETPPKQKKTHRFRRVKKRWIAIVIIVLILGVVGYFAGKFMLATGRVFSGNVLDLLTSNVALKEDENGRTNILVFGTSEDDAGHAGAALTDSIMVISLDQDKKTVAMVSMPRDMWVDYGTGCVWGYSGKINALYSCYASDGDAAMGATKLGEKVGEVFGLQVQYYTKVNYSVVRDITTALGGVTVNIEGAFGADGIYDSNMGKLLKLPNGPATLQGEQALAFVRARGEGYGSYGINGNFSREQNQQKMVVAIRDKALSLGTLSNPVAVSNLLDVLGNNILTNFSTAEIKTLAKVGKDVSESSIVHIDLNKEGESVLATGPYNGQSIVRPKAGIGDFTDIQSYIRKYLTGSGIVTENASIEILNASTTAGIAAEKADEFDAEGLVNISTNDTPYSSTTPVTWYDTTGGGKPKTAAKLASLLGKQATGSSLPSGVQSSADFVVVLGAQ